MSKLASVPTNVQNQTISQNNLLAYAPSYASHGGEHAAGFINLELVFPCGANRQQAVRCRKFTWEEDGANHGYEFVVITDKGNDLDIFGEDVQTLGFISANPNCKQIDPSESSGCFPRNTAFTILCSLPSKNCQ